MRLCEGNMLLFFKEVKMIYLIGGILGLGIITYALISVPKTKEEQRREDEEQMEYLRKWRETHKM